MVDHLKKKRENPWLFVGENPAFKETPSWCKISENYRNKVVYISQPMCEMRGF